MAGSDAREKEKIYARLRGGLIVSVQPDAHDAAHDPMNQPEIMAALAQAVLLGGASGIRADSPSHLRAIRAVTAVPLIGLFKADLSGYAVRITPTLEHARAIADAGADVIALDATYRQRPLGLTAADFIRQVKEETGCLVMADIATHAEGCAAAEAGADFVATTLSGYTAESPLQAEPDFELVRSLAAAVRVPVVAEGRINRPADAARMLECGAFAVTVGSAITRPRSITESYVQVIRPGGKNAGSN